MGVETVTIIIMAKQQIARQCIGHGYHISAAPEICKEFLHLRLKKQAVPKHQIGAGHGDNIAAGLAVAMRVNPRAHQRAHLNQITAHLPCGIRDHARGRNNLKPLLCMASGREAEQ